MRMHARDGWGAGYRIRNYLPALPAGGGPRLTPRGIALSWCVEGIQCLLRLHNRSEQLLETLCWRLARPGPLWGPLVFLLPL